MDDFEGVKICQKGKKGAQIVSHSTISGAGGGRLIDFKKLFGLKNPFLMPDSEIEKLMIDLKRFISIRRYPKSSKPMQLYCETRQGGILLCIENQFPSSWIKHWLGTGFGNLFKAGFISTVDSHLKCIKMDPFHFSRVPSTKFLEMFTNHY